MRAALILMILIAIPLATAEIVAQYPSNDTTIDPSKDRLTFTVQSTSTIESCSLHIDGEVTKTLPYGEKLSGKVIRYDAGTLEGTHSWQITCQTEDGQTLSTEERIVHLQGDNDQVTVISSGTFRGSFVHQFKLEDESVTVPKVAPGDFLEVTLTIPPSTITQDIYVKNRLVENGIPYLTLEVGRTPYRVSLEETAILQIRGVTIYVTFENIVNNKNTLVVSREDPSIVENEEVCAQVITPAVNTQTSECVEYPTPCDVPEGWEVVQTCGPSEEPQEIEEPVEEEPPTNQPKEQELEDEEPKPSLLQRFIGWLSNLFG